MLSQGQSRSKAESDARNQEANRLKDRRRNLIILIEKYLLDNGYVDALSKLEAETTLSLSNWDTADNMDLFLILTEFEQFYEIKYGKPPKLVKKATGDENALPRLNKRPPVSRTPSNASSSTNASSNSGARGKSSSNQKGTSVGSKGSTPSLKKEDSSGVEGLEIKGESVDPLTGNKEQKPKEESDEFFIGRLLKGLPDYGNNPELMALAQSLQRDIVVVNPNVKFTDVVGLEDAKVVLKEAVMLPIMYPQLFSGLLEPWKGLLLFGPPGTGKTMLAKAVATETRTTFFNISASSIVSKWRGDSEKLVRVLFDLARHHQPSTVFLDEIDSIMSQRGSHDTEHEGSRRMKTELLIQMDGLLRSDDVVFVLAASNMPWDLDAALLRRLDKRILVNLPESKARESLLKEYLPETRTKDINYKEVAAATEGYSGSDIRLVCKEASMKPVRRFLNKLELKSLEKKNKNQGLMGLIPTQKDMLPQLDPIDSKDMQDALEKTKPAPHPSVDRYEKWFKEFGSV